ncbi:MAG: hypothetical protein IPK16_18085 [Anaerolineales bacterium]|nr:hypothetical protein [Anaerolineales bacterium]
MSDQFVEYAKSQMGVIERLLKGLPGIGGYIDKELRRDADKRVRDGLAQLLDQDKAALLEVQNKLLNSGGLLFMDDLDGAIVKLQTLIDRVKTASYGYAGFFDAQRIKEPQLDALYRFDVAMVQEAGVLGGAIEALRNAVADKSNIGPTIDRVTQTIADLGRLYDKRKEAILAPDLLAQPGYAPDVAVPPVSNAATDVATPAASNAATDIANDPDAVG